MRARIRPIAFGVALIALFGLTAHFRFAALSTGFTNDQFFHLANAQQMLFGEWPTRDFLDTGMPLMYVVSALSQWWLGNTLFAEGIVVSFAFAIAAVLTALAVRELTGSAALGFIAGVLEVSIVPREYGYPKILTYALGFLLLQQYVTRPSMARTVALAGGVVIAFLFRHDHGIYLGGASVLAVWLAGGAAPAWRRTATFIGITALLAAPYLVYIQIVEGLWPYLQIGLEFRDREFGRAGYALPTLGGEQPLHAVLFYAYWTFPVLATGLVLRDRFSPRSGRPAEERGPAEAPGWTAAARVLPMVAVAVALNVTFARPPFDARLPDAVVPFLMIAAWLAAYAWRSRPAWAWRPIVAALTLLIGAAVFAVDRAGEQMERAGLLAPFGDWPEYARKSHALLAAPHEDVMVPSRPARQLVPFYDYLARCTTVEHRLLVAGLIPEVVFFAHRPFAGGQAVLPGGYFAGERYQRAVIEKLSAQTAPFVIIPGTRYMESFESSFPMVAAYVQRRYVPLATLGDDEETKVDILIDRDASAPATDQETGWPCLAPQA